jgi:hypothetical protein
MVERDAIKIPTALAPTAAAEGAQIQSALNNTYNNVTCKFTISLTIIHFRSDAYIIFK